MAQLQITVIALLAVALTAMQGVEAGPVQTRGLGERNSRQRTWSDRCLRIERHLLQSDYVRLLHAGSHWLDEWVPDQYFKLLKLRQWVKLDGNDIFYDRQQHDRYPRVSRAVVLRNVQSCRAWMSAWDSQQLSQSVYLLILWHESMVQQNKSLLSLQLQLMCILESLSWLLRLKTSIDHVLLLRLMPPLGGFTDLT